MLKTVLAGLGRIGWHMHLPNIMLHDGYLLSAVVDADKERLDEAKERYSDYPIKQDMSIDYYDKCYEYFALDKKPFVPIEDTLYVMEILQKLSEQDEIKELEKAEI